MWQLLYLAVAAFATNGPLCPSLAAAKGPPFPTPRPAHAADTLQLSYGAEPPTLDPALASDSQASEMVGQLFAGLVRFAGTDLRIEGDLAERWTCSADGRRYRFFLRDSRWSDGTKVTANDFVFSIRRALVRTLASPNAGLLFVIDQAEAAYEGRAPLSAVGVAARGPSTLDIRLTRPAPYFLQLCTHAAMRPVPAHRLERAASWPKAEQLVVSGPYRVARWRFRRDVDLEANPYHWQARSLAIKRLHYDFIARPETAMALFADGELDISPAPVPLAFVPMVARSGELRRAPQLTTDFYWFNTERPPLDDVRVRQALSLAIDREQLVAAVLQRGQAAISLVPPALGGETLGPRSYDPNQARALLAAAGFPGGRGLRPLGITFNAHEEHRRVAEAIAAMWQKTLGVAVALSQQEWQVYLSEVNHRQFDIARLGWVADYADPRSFLLDVLGPHSQQNVSGWHDAAFAELLAKSDASADPAERMRWLKEAERRTLVGLPLLPLSHGQATQAVKPYVHGYAPSLLGPTPYHLVHQNEQPPASADR